MRQTQDTFFDEANRDLATVAGEMRDTMAQIDGMSIDREPAEITIGRRPAGRPAWRIDFNGVGLYRAMIIVEGLAALCAVSCRASSPVCNPALCDFASMLQSTSYGESRLKAGRRPWHTP